MSLSREAQFLVDAARREQRGPSDAQRARWRRGVMAAIGTGTVAGATTTSAAAATTVAVSAKIGLTTKVGLGLFALAVAGGGAVLLRTSDESGAPHRSVPAQVGSAAPQTDRLVQPPVATGAPVATTAVSAAPAPPPTVSADAANAPVARPSARAPSVASSVATSGNDLAEETRLLGEAQAALGAGRAADALAALDAHATRFPKGALALERRALRAMALCASGRATEGRSEAAAIEAQIPGSPLAKRVAETCR